MTLGQRIAGLRKAAGLAQHELARKLEVPESTISKWERDDRMPDSSSLAMLAQALGTTMDYLYGRKRFTADEIRTWPVIRLVLEEMADAPPTDDELEEIMGVARFHNSANRTDLGAVIGIRNALRGLHTAASTVEDAAAQEAKKRFSDPSVPARRSKK